MSKRPPPTSGTDSGGTDWRGTSGVMSVMSRAPLLRLRLSKFCAPPCGCAISLSTHSRRIRRQLAVTGEISAPREPVSDVAGQARKRSSVWRDKRVLGDLPDVATVDE